MEKLSAQEEEAMQAIWRTGEGHVKLFLEAMDEPRPPYTTLASTIKNLQKKGYLNSRLVGNAIGEYPGFTRAGAGDNHHRTFGLLYCFSL